MNIQKLIEILLELRSAIQQLGSKPSEYSLKEVMNTYNMLFLGENFNCIYSNELAHCIKTIFDIPVKNDELNELIPDACKILNMRFEPMVEVAKISQPNPPIACYQITLW